MAVVHWDDGHGVLPVRDAVDEVRDELRDRRIWLPLSWPAAGVHSAVRPRREGVAAAADHGLSTVPGPGRPRSGAVVRALGKAKLARTDRAAAA
jgi:hypothetical protein